MILLYMEDNELNDEIICLNSFIVFVNNYVDWIGFKIKVNINVMVNVFIIMKKEWFNLLIYIWLCLFLLYW